MSRRIVYVICILVVAFVSWGLWHNYNLPKQESVLPVETETVPVVSFDPSAFQVVEPEIVERSTNDIGYIFVDSDGNFTVSSEDADMIRDVQVTGEEPKFEVTAMHLSKTEGGTPLIVIRDVLADKENVYAYLLRMP